MGRLCDQLTVSFGQFVSRAESHRICAALYLESCIPEQTASASRPRSPASSRAPGSPGSERRSRATSHKRAARWRACADGPSGTPPAGCVSPACWRRTRAGGCWASQAWMWPGSSRREVWTSQEETQLKSRTQRGWAIRREECRRSGTDGPSRP